MIPQVMGGANLKIHTKHRKQIAKHRRRIPSRDYEGHHPAVDNVIPALKVLRDVLEDIQDVELDILWQVVPGRELIEGDIKAIDVGFGQTGGDLESPYADTHQLAIL